jgi:hypothetical protein
MKIAFYTKKVDKSTELGKNANGDKKSSSLLCSVDKKAEK